MLQIAIESLLESRDVRLRVVVVSNGCTEPLPRIVEDERVAVTQAPEPIGFSEANNLGVRFAERTWGTPDYWYFANNDTRHTPEAVVAQVRALEERPRAAIAGPRLMILGAEDHLNSLGINVTRDGWGWDEGIGLSLEEYGPLPQSREVLAVTGSALLVEASLFARIGGWTEIYGYYFEDVDLCLKAAKLGRAVVHVVDAVVYHRISATAGVASERKLFLFRRNRLILALIHWPFFLAARVMRDARRQLLETERDDLELLEKAYSEVRTCWDGILAARRSLGRDDSWVESLRPVGSVPDITLPEVRTSSDGDSTHDEILAEVERLAPEPDRRRVLVVGSGPLPFEDERMNYAPGGRTWQLAAPLAEDGHAVVVLICRIPGAFHDERPGSRMTLRDGVLCVSLDPGSFERGHLARAVVARFRPNAVIGTSTVPAFRALDWISDLPFWVDVFGDPMAEGQARQAVCPDVDTRVAYAEYFLPLLQRGDAFSAVSVRQGYALTGQLGLAGRLDGSTAVNGLVAVVPCAASRAESDVPEPLREIEGVPSGARVLLWSGGYNTWCDLDLLFGALAVLMDEFVDLHFVSTGGPIDGHDEGTYPQFRQSVAAASWSSRAHFLGRVDLASLRAVTARAEVCVVTERAIPERVLGSSARVVGWLGAGKAVVCSRASELGELLHVEDLAKTYTPGDGAELLEALRRSLGDREAAIGRGQRAAAWMAKRGAASVTTAAVRTWVRNPRRRPGAPALVELRDRERDRLLESTRAELAAAKQEVECLTASLQASSEAYHRIRSELGDIHVSRMWRAWTAYHKLAGLWKP